MPRIVIVGGYGAFGSRVAERLARETDLEIIIAGRSAARAEAAAQMLARQSGRPVAHAALDAAAAGGASLAALAPHIVINASGPFQTSNYALARAAIARGAHYLDLADAREHVVGITALDAAAERARVLVASGASSVPGLAGAVLDHFAPEFATLEAMRHGISPANSYDPGPATTASILGAIGKPFEVRRGGARRVVYGWQRLERHRFPELGRRWMAYCNVPDLELLPARYPSLETVEFSGGLEVPLFHLGVWALSWPSRLGLLRAPERLADPLLRLKRRLDFLGSDKSGMFVVLGGRDAAARPKRVTWHLIARRDQGSYVPALPAVIIAKKLARDSLAARGATPCLGLFTLPEFLSECADLDIEAMTSRQSG